MAAEEKGVEAVAGPDVSTMKVGVCYNVFDGHELLEASILAIKREVHFVCVVYQTVSNFGMPADASLVPTLEWLKEQRLVDKLVAYVPTPFDMERRRNLISPRATGVDLGGVDVSAIGEQFLNELTKRELGRQACLEAGCNYFMCLDTDEFYLTDQLAFVKRRMLEGNYECGLVNMRFFYKLPTIELLPVENENFVPVMYKCQADYDFRLGCPYPFLVDPTRKLNKLTRLVVFKREECEMYHMSYVRSDIGRKIANVSNRGNMTDLATFASKFLAWTPGKPIVLPHAYWQKHFTKWEERPNLFNIPFQDNGTHGIVVGKVVGARPASGGAAAAGAGKKKKK